MARYSLLNLLNIWKNRSFSKTKYVLLIFGVLALLAAVVISCAQSKDEKTVALEQENVRYTVSSYEKYCADIPEEQDTETVLYVATCQMPQSFYRALTEWVERSYGYRIEIEDPETWFQPPIAVFCLWDSDEYSKANVGQKFLVPVLYDGRILEFYSVSGSDSGDIFVCKRADIAEELTDLAPKTSLDAPLAYIADGYSTYVRIGEDAVWIKSAPVDTMRSEISEIYTSNQNIVIAEIILQ